MTPEERLLSEVRGRVDILLTAARKQESGEGILSLETVISELKYLSEFLLVDY
jgi:hypothetical protein